MAAAWTPCGARLAVAAPPSGQPCSPTFLAYPEASAPADSPLRVAPIAISPAPTNTTSLVLTGRCDVCSVPEPDSSPYRCSVKRVKSDNGEILYHMYHGRSGELPLEVAPIANAGTGLR